MLLRLLSAASFSLTISMSVLLSWFWLHSDHNYLWLKRLFTAEHIQSVPKVSDIILLAIAEVALRPHAIQSPSGFR